MRVISDKRGSAESVSWPEIMWIILFIVFMSVFFIFIKNSIGGASVYEELYAKKIALIIDGAKPGSDIKLDVTDAVNLAKKLKKSPDRARNESFSINKDKNYVKVSLGSGMGGYLYYYFSDCNISITKPNIGLDGRATIQINVEEKNVK